MSDRDSALLATLLLFTALLLSLLVLSQIASTYMTAYLAAPTEIAAFIDAVDFSVQENESCDRDVARVQRLEDKLRLGRLLREIQKCGDDLREDLNTLVVDENDTRLKYSSRLIWASTKKRLEERVRRMDMLRMRFLVVYMGLMAANIPSATDSISSMRERERGRERDYFEKEPLTPSPTARFAARPGLSENLARSLTRNPPTPLRRIATQPPPPPPPPPPLPPLPVAPDSAPMIGHHSMGWAGVVAELQQSPLMHKRRASSETPNRLF